MYYNYAASTATTQTSEFLALLESVSSFFSLGLSILGIVALWKLFTKAGEEGWKAIVPVYSSYTLFKLVWKVGAFWGMVASVVGMIVGYILLMIGLMGEIYLLAVPAVLMIIAGIIGIFVLNILCAVKTGKAYGRGGPFVLGLIFLGRIFRCILAFDNTVTYHGPQK